MGEADVRHGGSGGCRLARWGGTNLVAEADAKKLHGGAGAREADVRHTARKEADGGPWWAGEADVG